MVLLHNLAIFQLCHFCYLRRQVTKNVSHIDTNLAALMLIISSGLYITDQVQSQDDCFLGTFLSVHSNAMRRGVNRGMQIH